MLPNMAIRHRHAPGDTLAHRGYVLRWSNVRDRHRGELRAAVAIVTNRRVVHAQKLERLGVEDPHWKRATFEQDLVSSLRRAQVVLGSSMCLPNFGLAKLTLDRWRQTKESVFGHEVVRTASEGCDDPLLADRA